MDITMALIDVVKCEVNSSELIYKFPSNDLRIGTQLVVYPGQEAFFIKGGKIYDRFESGTHTIKTENIPLLNKLINLPFGGDSPFQAEVWFINRLAIMDIKWGTPTPIQLEDPKYGVIVPVRAFGQFGLKVADSQVFLETLVGNMASFTTENVNSYFKGKMISGLANMISDKMTRDNISVLNINSHLSDMSEYMRTQLDKEFLSYGLSMSSFSIMSINVPEDDPSFIQLKKAKALAAEVNITGRDIYQMGRTFDVMQTAASNEGAGGSLMGMGVGLGAGAGAGVQMGQAIAQNMTTNVAPPPLPQSTTYFVVVKGQQAGPYDAATISAHISSGQLTAETLAWKQGLPNWVKLSALTEFENQFAQCPPPIPMP